MELSRDINNHYIYLEVRNPKKQAVVEKLKSIACYLVKSDDLATDKQRRGS